MHKGVAAAAARNNKKKDGDGDERFLEAVGAWVGDATAVVEGLETAMAATRRLFEEGAAARLGLKASDGPDGVFGLLATFKGMWVGASRANAAAAAREAREAWLAKYKEEQRAAAEARRAAKAARDAEAAEAAAAAAAGGGGAGGGGDGGAAAAARRTKRMAAARGGALPRSAADEQEDPPPRRRRSRRRRRRAHLQGLRQAFPRLGRHVCQVPSRCGAQVDGGGADGRRVRRVRQACLRRRTTRRGWPSLPPQVPGAPGLLQLRLLPGGAQGRELLVRGDQVRHVARTEGRAPQPPSAPRSSRPLRFYCHAHFKQQFALKGNYEFAEEKPSGAEEGGGGGLQTPTSPRSPPGVSRTSVTRVELLLLPSPALAECLADDRLAPAVGWSARVGDADTRPPPGSGGRHSR